MICPLIRVCQHKVSMEHYTNVCSHPTEDNYKKCQFYQAEAQATRTPLDWSEKLTGFKLKIP